MNIGEVSRGLYHCYTRGVYYYFYSIWGKGIGGQYVVDDFGNLIKTGP